MNVSERIEALNISATTAAKQVLLGGRYVFAVVATWGGGTVKLQMLGPNGSTWLDVTNASFTADGYIGVELPAGSQVRFNVATATAVYATVVRAPQG